MAVVSVTASLLARNSSVGLTQVDKFTQSLTASSGSTEAPNKYKITFPKSTLSNAFLVVYDNSTVINELTVLASTQADFVAEGNGDLVLESAASGDFTVSSSVRKVYGPFESARFLDSATGANVMYVTVGSSTGAFCTGFQLGAFQVIPSS